MRRLIDRYTQTTRLVLPHIGWAIHHSAPPAGLTFSNEVAHLDSIDRYHRQVRGWSFGIGYHVAVFPSGNAYQVGRYHTARAHVRAKNNLYAGMVFIGDFSHSQPTDAALKTAREVIRLSGIPGSGGHKQLQDGTACPGSWNLDLLKSQPMLSPRLSLKRPRWVAWAWALMRLNGNSITELPPDDTTDWYKVGFRR